MSISSRIISLAAKLDLGRKMGDMCGAACGPGSAPRTVYYPSIWVDDQEKPVDLPKSGKAVVEYKVVSRTSRERDGQTKHDASIEIHSIAPIDDEKKKPAPKPGSAKPVNLSSLSPGMISFARVRNGDGEFAPQTASGADPGAMQKTYGPAMISKRKIAAVSGGVGALGAAALLARRLRRPA